MSDELRELKRANPVRPEQLEAAVSMDWRQAVEMLEAEDRVNSHLTTSTAGRSVNSRTVYTALSAAVAAVAVIAVVALGSSPPVDENRVIEQANDTTTSVLVVEQIETTKPAPSTSHESSEEETTTTTRAVTAQGPFNPKIDLLVVHFDFAHTDDGHAAAASREAATALGLEPLVVAGTKATDSPESNRPYQELMPIIWGDRWIDATANRQAAVASAATQWLASLDRGGRVWIAEGGVSDFTAEVLQEVIALRPGLDTTKAVHVVQHVQRNEDATQNAAAGLVQAKANYIRIDDGNSSNDTANLKGASSDFENAALDGDYSAAWKAAFAYKPASDLDFSDTVGLLHIVGVGTNQVADPADFADYFMN